eukprot:TRINITY_DN17887_c0_g1_i1.p1 TRINITY_DN17887_c0_g1~~TRINITY_DN17887_c0_g1_i1.p1  ORF type:complete len:246 (-),score=8.42 TRINITY_DN17887_c0_g1_i1:4-741(-)
MLMIIQKANWTTPRLRRNARWNQDTGTCRNSKNLPASQYINRTLQSKERLMKIIQFSDIHAGGPAEDWMGYLDKRWVGVFNYSFRRKFQHDLNKLHTAVDYILAEKPDLAVCTGDLTSTGQPGEFEKVKVILKRIVESDVPLFFVPGNHDFYVYRKRCVNAMKYMVEYLNQGRYDFDRLPVALEHGGLDFVIINECWPSNLLSSHCWVRPAHSRQVENFCTGEKTRPRVLIGHYPLIEVHPITLR